jgi:tetratricopeptide (TPR) repeat protein
VTHKGSTPAPPEPVTLPGVAGDDPPVAHAGGDAVGIAALALQSGSADPALRADLQEFLRRQSALADEQRAVSRKQGELVDRRIARSAAEQDVIEAQAQHLHLQHVHDRLRLVLDVGLAALGVALIGGLAFMLYGAVTDRSIVVNAFSVPPALEAQGRTGAAVAARFLDELGRLRTLNRTGGDKRELVGALDEQVQAEIPEVHVSFGELRRLLHEALGRRTQIRGSIVETAEGVALTLRGTGLAPRTFRGAAGALDALVVEAAEYAYGRADPTQMAYYLHRAGRLQDTVAFIKSSFATATPDERAVLLNVWGDELNDELRPLDALAKFRAAIALRPDYWNPWTNSVNTLGLAGREEEALHLGEQWERVAHRGERSELDGVHDLFPVLDNLRWDLPESIRAYRADLDATGGHGTYESENGPVVAYEYALQHDAASAETLLQTSPDADTDEFSILEALLVRGALAFDVGRDTAAAQRLDEWRARLATAAPNVASQFVGLDCWLPAIYARAGRRADAEAAIASTAKESFVDCHRFRGDAQDHLGNLAQAEKEFAAGVALAPSLPPVYQSWGLALLRHQDFAGAIGKFAAAHQRGPHWADPLEYWGEALAAQGHPKEAADKYAEAVKYAPNWGALHLHSGEALDHLGDRPKALEEFRRAHELALSDADKATVDARLAAR